MSKYEIYGGNKLSGEITLESAKNSVLPMLAGAILTDEQVVIKNCPNITDVKNMIGILRSLGVKVVRQEKSVIISGSAIKEKIPSGLAKELRSSVFMLGALVGKLGRAKITYPGGCNIGLRPIDLHVKAISELGVKIEESFGEISCVAEKLKGKAIYLDFPSVGATENVMLAAVLAEGKTEIHNPAKEPEIVDLMNFLNSMGAKIYGAGTSIILIDGVKKLHGSEYLPMADRIEAGTFLTAAAITGGEIAVKGLEGKNIYSLINKFCDYTCKIRIVNDIIYLTGNKRGKPFVVDTGPYPCFPTDLQAQITALAVFADGVSAITENVFETRFNHIPELIKMGADITVKGRTALIKGIPKLFGTKVQAMDLRGGASLVLAGLNAEGVTTVEGIKHIERGYSDFEGKLNSLGAKIRKING